MLIGWRHKKKHRLKLKGEVEVCLAGKAGSSTVLRPFYLAFSFTPSDLTYHDDDPQAMSNIFIYVVKSKCVKKTSKTARA